MTNIVSQLMDLGREEGYDDGYEKKGEEVAYNFLEAGCEPIFVAKNTGLTLDRCKEIRAQIKRDQQTQDQ